MQRTFKRWTMLAATIVSAASLLSGCSGSDGTNGVDGVVDPAMVDSAVAARMLADLKVESCATCHNSSGTDHQALYKSAMNVTALTAAITNVVVGAVDVNGKYPTTATFTLAFNGAPYDVAVSGGKFVTAATTTDGKSIEKTTYAATLYNTATRTFLNAGSLSTLTRTAAATYTVTGALTADITASNGFIYMYFTKDPAEIAPTGNIILYKYVCNIAKKYGTVDYATAAPVAGCQKCHPTPYLKHGYRAADVQGNTIPTMAACKACHYDNRPGSDAGPFFGDETYQYTANIMSDVHASHNNEFPYPQAMANCVTCHPAGASLDVVLTDANFRKDVCETCHANVAATNTVVKKPLRSIMPHDIPTAECNTCHKVGGAASSAVFSAVHPGFDSTKYDSALAATNGKLRYTYFIDSIVKDGNNLKITWGAQTAAGVAVDVLNTDATGGKPVFLGLPADRANESEGVRIMVGYYGWGTNNIANYDNYQKAAILANTTYANGKALTTFALTSKLADNKAVKLEVGIIGVPQVNGKMVAVKSETKGIVLADGSLADRSKIVDNAKCNTCHDNILIHTGDSHGHTAVGNVNACEFCHNPSSGSGHYAQQSKSIDSYLHSIHAFPTEEEFVFPMFTPLNCEACHVAGTYNVPDQTKSLGGVIDGGDITKTTDDVTVGPASRACASCHRALSIRENGGATANSVTVNASINAHTEQNGYRIPLSPVSSFIDVINTVFKKLQ